MAQSTRHLIPIYDNMELDTKSRTWIATFAWPDASPPTETAIPSIGYKSAHLKYSNNNQTVSIWFSFPNQVRASTITNSIYGDVVIKKVNPTTHLNRFLDLPCSFEVRKSATEVKNAKPDEHGAAGSLEPEPADSGSSEPAHADHYHDPRITDVSNDCATKFKLEPFEPRDSVSVSLDSLLDQRAICKKRSIDALSQVELLDKRIRLIFDERMR